MSGGVAIVGTCLSVNLACLRHPPAPLPARGCLVVYSPRGIKEAQVVACYDQVTMTGGGVGSLSPWTSQSNEHGPGGYAVGGVGTCRRAIACAQVHVRGGVSWGGGQHGRAGTGRVWRVAASEGGGAPGDKEAEWMGGGGVRRSVRAAVWASRFCFYYRFRFFAR